MPNPADIMKQSVLNLVGRKLGGVEQWENENPEANEYDLSGYSPVHDSSTEPDEMVGIWKALDETGYRVGSVQDPESDVPERIMAVTSKGMIPDTASGLMDVGGIRVEPTIWKNPGLQAAIKRLIELRNPELQVPSAGGEEQIPFPTPQRRPLVSQQPTRGISPKLGR